MSGPHSSTVTGLRPIKADGGRVCSLAGIAQAEDKVVELSKVQAGLDIAIRDLEAQGKKDLTTARVFMVLKWTKLTCDAFIGMAAVLSSGGDKVKAAYGVGGVIADSATKAVLGQKVDYGTAGLTAVKEGVGALSNKTLKFGVTTSVIKIEVVVNAVNSKPDEILKSAAEYTHELLKFTLDALEKESAAKFTDLAKETFTYHQKLAELVEESVTNEQSLKLNQLGQKTTLTSLSRRIQKQIDRLEDFVRTCEMQLDRDTVKMSMPIR